MPSLLSRAMSRTVVAARVAAAARRRGVTIDTSARIGPKVSLRTHGSGRVIIGPGVEIASLTSILAMDGATVVIENDVFIGGLCMIAAHDSIRIGSGTMVAEMVGIRDHDHDPDRPPREGRILSTPVVIGQRAWLASKCTVVRGGGVGDDSVIGAHGLVNRVVPANSLAVGVPARVVRTIDRSVPPVGDAAHHDRA